jgi:CBS domain-containing protein
MASEIAEIARFLGGTPPFDALEQDRVAKLSRMVTVSYAPRGEIVLESGSQNDRLFIVRSGSVELRLAGADLTARLSTGSCFAYPSLLRGGEVHNQTVAFEDCLLYAIPAEEFFALREESKRFREYFADDEAARIRHALKRQSKGRSLNLDRTSLDQLVRDRTPVSCAGDVSIRDAVRLMAERDVSTLAICNEDRLVGIFTDKDLRKRVAAREVAFDRPIADVMTAGPQTLSTHGSVAEAMAMMASGGFRHIPLLDASGALAGILSATDILSFLGNNAIDTGMAIAKAADVDTLIEATRQIAEGFAAMVGSGVLASHAMRFTSALGEAAHRRAAQLAEQELGEPPVPYALLVFGSLAREEQLVGSDQDNGLLLSDDVDEAGREYFARLGARISDILDACGFVYCKGGIMAKNADQRLTLNEWRDRYRTWITAPTEDGILRATIFFDMRCVHGDAALVSALREEVVAMARADGLFVSFMARDALRSKVPLGIFRNLVLEKSEDGQKVFDAKAQAIMPVIDIARALSLANGIAAVGTMDRLAALVEAGKMAKDDAQSLEDAFLFVNELRITHQADQVRQGAMPDNALAPAALSSLERDYLKDAFSVIRSALDSLRRNLAGGIA